MSKLQQYEEIEEFINFGDSREFLEYLRDRPFLISFALSKTLEDNFELYEFLRGELNSTTFTPFEISYIIRNKNLKYIAKFFEKYNIKITAEIINKTLETKEKEKIDYILSLERSNSVSVSALQAATIAGNLYAIEKIFQKLSTSFDILAGILINSTLPENQKLPIVERFLEAGAGNGFQGTGLFMSAIHEEHFKIARLIFEKSRYDTIKLNSLFQNLILQNNKTFSRKYSEGMKIILSSKNFEPLYKPKIILGYDMINVLVKDGRVDLTDVELDIPVSKENLVKYFKKYRKIQKLKRNLEDLEDIYEYISNNPTELEKKGLVGFDIMQGQIRNYIYEITREMKLLTN